MIAIYSVVLAFTVDSYQEFNPKEILPTEVEKIANKHKVSLMTEEEIKSFEEWKKSSVFQYNWYWRIGQSETELYAQYLNDTSIGEKRSDGFFDIVDNTFGAVGSGFGLMFDLLTFNILSPVEIPVWLTWIPFLLVFPVWVAVIIWLLPVIIKLIGAIGNWIPL